MFAGLKQEGLFRKSGQLNRQKVLRERLNCGEDVSGDLEAGEYSAHDCANLLKAYLAELPEPLLLERHYKAFCQVPGIQYMHKRPYIPYFARLMPMLGFLFIPIFAKI